MLSLRSANILLRSLHLLGVAGIGGGFLFALPEAQWQPYGYLTLASGMGMVLLYLYESRTWPVRLKGLVILLKLLLLGAALQWPAWRAELFALVLLLSGWIAHAPGWVRGWRWYGSDPG